jgi:SAM-dependent methyltransferase
MLSFQRNDDGHSFGMAPVRGLSVIAATGSLIGPDSHGLIAFGRDTFDAARAMKSEKGDLAVFGMQSFPQGTDVSIALEQAYADLLTNRFALSVGLIGDRGFILTGERGIALATSLDDLSAKFASLFQSRFGQSHNKTDLQIVPAFPANIEADCADMYRWMREWEKLALFPSYQADVSTAVHPGAEFGFVAKRTDEGTLVTARASNKTNPGPRDVTLITDVSARGDVTVQSLQRKASLNGPLAHLIFENRPDVNYIVHSHVFLPEGVTMPEPSAPGTSADWDAIAPAVMDGATIINQPCHGCLILLDKPEELLPLLKRQSLYRAQSSLYDTAYARFQSFEDKPTGFERYIKAQQFSPDLRVLDLCCGTGASTQALKNLGFTRIDIADGSASMLAVAEARHGLTGRVVQLEDLSPLPRNTYDLITIRQAFNYVSDEQLANVFSRAADALAPGGHFIFNSFLPLADNVDRRSNSTSIDGVIAHTTEINTVSGDIVRHAQRSEIIDTIRGEWQPVLDINEFFQHDPTSVVKALKAAGLQASAFIDGKSVCYHAIKQGLRHG